MSEYPKWVGTDPDDPSKGTIVHNDGEEAALLSRPAPEPVQDVLAVDEDEEPVEDEEPAKPKKK